MENGRRCNEMVVERMKWKQCPQCARWFIANRKQMYCSPICGQRFRTTLARLEREKEQEKYKPIRYMSKGGEMYERSYHGQTY